MLYSEQPVNIEFCVLLQKPTSETPELVQAYGDEGMKTSQVYE